MRRMHGKKSFEQNKKDGASTVCNFTFEIPNHKIHYSNITHSVFITLSTIGLCVVVAIVAFLGKIIH